jgi:opacity protein-like surface antigen
MFKKALIASAILAASTGVAFANGGSYTPAPVATSSYNFYVGVGVSRDFGSFKTDIADFVTPLSTTNLFQAQAMDLGKDGWSGDLNAGVGFTFQDHYYLAGEIFGSISNLKAGNALLYPVVAGTPTAGNFTQVKLQHSFGIRVIPGVKLNDSTMLYGAVGYINSRFEVGSSLVALPSGSSSDEIVNFKKNEGGLQLGLGLETMLTNNVSGRIEYDWDRYGKLNGVGTSANGFFARAISVKPTVDQAKLQVAYHFMGS